MADRTVHVGAVNNGPYGPYMMFIPENMDRAVYILVELYCRSWTEQLEIQNCVTKDHDVQMAIFASSARSKFKIFKIPKTTLKYILFVL